MSGLQEFVARAIMADQDCGGADLLTAKEVAALEWAILRPLTSASAFEKAQWDQEGEQQHRLVLAGLIADLGPSKLSVCGQQQRAGAYYLHCANVAIAAYDRWLEQRQGMTP